MEPNPACRYPTSWSIVRRPLQSWADSDVFYIGGVLGRESFCIRYVICIGTSRAIGTYIV